MIPNILQKLKEIEKSHNIKILYAAESGSRAYKTNTPTSDYDVRFIYKQLDNPYISVFPTKNNISLKIEDNIDIFGWDIKTALFLLHKSNTSILECIANPEPYIDCNLSNSWLETINPYLDYASLYNHYKGIGYNSLKQSKYSIEPEDILKSTLNASRAALSIDYIKEFQAFPPIEFNALLRATNNEDTNNIGKLLNARKNNTEFNTDSLREINKFIEEKLETKYNFPNIDKTPLIEKIDKIYKKLIL